MPARRKRPPPSFYDWHESFEALRGHRSSSKQLHDLDFTKQTKRPEFISVEDAHLPYKANCGLGPYEQY